MATYTTNYGLHQWAPSDDFLRTDFNEDFKKIDTVIKGTEQSLRTDFKEDVERIDTALKTTEQSLRNDLNGAVSRLETTLQRKVEIVIGTYTGNGAEEQAIQLGFPPLAVLVENSEGQRGAEGYYRFGGLILPGHTCLIGRIQGNSFVVYNSYDNITRVRCYSNFEGVSFYYLALR